MAFGRRLLDLLTNAYSNHLLNFVKVPNFDKVFFSSLKS